MQCIGTQFTYSTCSENWNLSSGKADNGVGWEKEKVAFKVLW